MKTDNWSKFNAIAETYLNGNVSYSIEVINKMTKVNLIRFSIFISLEYPELYLRVNDKNHITLSHK
jgi:hypothetical protein